MVVTVTIKHIFKYPIEFVAQTHFNKYPTEKERFVLRIDTFEQNVDKATGVDYRRRIAVCENVIPRLLRKINFLNVPYILLEEEAWLDKRKRRLLLESRSLTFTEYSHMWETSTFRPHEENSRWTVLEQYGEIDIKGLGTFGRIIELFAQTFLNKGVHRGLNIMEELLLEKWPSFQAAEPCKDPAYKPRGSVVQLSPLELPIVHYLYEHFAS